MNPFSIPNERIWAQIWELYCLLQVTPSPFTQFTGEKAVDRKEGSSAKITEGQVQHKFCLESRMHFSVQVQPKSQAFAKVPGGSNSPMTKEIKREIVQVENGHKG